MDGVFRRRLGTMILLILINAGLFAIPAQIIYENVKDLIVDELKKNAINTAVSVASFVEMDIDSYKEITKLESYNDSNYDKKYYEEMLMIFNDIKQKTGATFIFTEKKISDAKTAYIFDGEEPSSSQFSPIGTEDSMGEVELEVFKNGKADATDMIEDSYWGTFLTGFAPIKDKANNQVIGIVGVDFSISYVENLLKNVQQIIMISFFAVMLLATAVVYIILDLKYRAFERDYLTDLFSKGYHEQQLRKIIDHSTWTGLPLSLAMLDIDDFKNINDKYGHIIGDEILKTISKTIKKNLRRGDICSRYGGDELIIILPATDERESLMICERIRTIIKDTEFQVSSGEVISLSVSIGIAMWNRKDNIEDFVGKADRAMYVSKKEGKNRITIDNEQLI